MVDDENDRVKAKRCDAVYSPYIRNLISVRNQSAYHLRSNDGLLLDFPCGKMLIFFCCCSHMVECITHLVKEIKNSSKV